MKPYPQFIISNMLVTLVFSVCIEQQITTQFYDISVNVPSFLSIKYYTICKNVMEELFGKVGDFTCTKTNGCTSANVAPFRQKPVINILNNMFMDIKNKSFLKSICREEVRATDGLITSFGHSVIIDKGYFFDPITRFLAAWDTNDLVTRTNVTLFRGKVKKSRLNNSSEYISFINEGHNYNIRLNTEGSTNNNIIIQKWNSTETKFDTRYFPYIKATNFHFLPYCKNFCSCKGIKDFITFSPKSDDSQLNLSISLSFNGLEVIIIIGLLIFILSGHYKKISYSNKNPQGNKTDKAEYEKPSSYLHPNRKDHPNEFSTPGTPLSNLKNTNSKEMPTEFHEYFTVGSDKPKQYEVLKASNSSSEDAVRTYRKPELPPKDAVRKYRKP